MCEKCIFNKSLLTRYDKNFSQLPLLYNFIHIMKLRATLKSVTDFVDFQIYVRYMYFKALFRRYKTSNMDV